MGSNLPVARIDEQPLFPELPPRPSFVQRIQRAHDLAERYPSASEILNFYARLTFHQQHVFDCLRESLTADEVLSSCEEWTPAMDVLLGHFPLFAKAISEIAPFPMRARASELAEARSAEQCQLLTAFWASRGDEQESASPIDRTIVISFLQPYAELLAGAQAQRPSTPSGSACPICGSQPICGVLRDRAHGAGRSLVCSLCMTEWSFLRVVCPACGEDRFESLPVFHCDDRAQARIDACDTCRHYVKTVDMTKDGLAVPVVDELAAVSLDLWAKEQGYQKLTTNLAGI